MLSGVIGFIVFLKVFRQYFSADISAIVKVCILTSLIFWFTGAHAQD